MNYEDVAREIHRANTYELLYRRAADGARAASKGAERLHRKVCRLEAEVVELEDEIDLLEARLRRSEAEKATLAEKVERLSLRLLHEWGNQ